MAVLKLNQGKNSRPAVKLVFYRDAPQELALSDQVKRYPELRYMGPKARLLPWIHGLLNTLDF